MTARPTPATTAATRAALLQAAAAVFAERGYQLARVRDIASRAGVNLAAMNYHFGGKQKLYLAVLQSSAAERLSAFPLPDAGLATRGAARGRERLLRLAVRNLLGRFLSTEHSSLLPQLFVRELANPTPALQTIIDSVARPQFALLQRVVREFLGEAARPEELRRGAFSVLAQCVFYLFARPVVSQLDPGVYADAAALDRLADHIARFSAAGLLAQRRRAHGGTHALN